MSQTDKPGSKDDLLRSEIQERLPGIADQIEGAIHTLRRLQEIAEPGLAARAPGPGSPARSDVLDPSLMATADGDSAAPAHKGASSEPTFQAGVRARPAARALEAGEAFGRYQVVRHLGRGAMGSVCLAYDTQLQRHVALKTPALGDNPQIIDRFFREARAAAQLRSPYLCPVHDVGLIGEVYYLSMAFIDGKPLSQALTDGSFADLRAAAAVLGKIARGLQKAHEAGVIHRDLKPDNIMIDKDGEPVVMDFGLARWSEDDVQLTAAGKLLGTPAYMSPEQVEGDQKSIGPATDIYSLGVVLYQLLTGQLPFRGSLTSVLRQIGAAEPPRPSSLRPELAETALEALCTRMMAKAREARPASMAEVAEALEKASAPRAEAPPAPPSFWGRLRGWLGGG